MQNLKSKVQDNLAVPPARHRLIFAGAVLADNFTLQDYSIIDNSVVQLVITPLISLNAGNDAALQGQLSAQAGAAGRLAGAQAGNIRGHLASAAARPAAAAGGGMPVWVSGGLDLGSIDRKAGRNDLSAQGFTAGVDLRPAKDLLAGLALGYGYDDTKVDGYGTRTRTSQATAGLYSGFTPGDWSFGAFAGFSGAYFKNHLWSASDSMLLKGDRRGRVLFAGADAARRFKAGAFSFTPSLGCQASGTRLYRYTQSGGDTASITGGRAKAAALSASAGLRAAYNISLAGGKLSPAADLSFRHSSGGNLSQGFSYTSQGASVETYRLRASGLSGDTAAAGAELSYSSAGGGSAYIGYTSARGQAGYRCGSFSAGISSRF